MFENGPASEPELASADGKLDESQSTETDPSGLADDLGLDIIAGLAEDGLASGAVAAPGRPTENLEDATANLLDVSLVLDVVQGLGERLSRRLDALQTTFDRELRAEATRERVIDRLHAELQEYKQDFLLKVQRPIFIDLIQLHDDIGKMIPARPDSDPEAEPDRNQGVRGVIESIQTAIEDILYRQGVEPFVLEGDEFDPRKQRAVSTYVTDDPGRNKRVASRLRKGFQAGDKLIRPEVVTVFTFRPAPPATDS
jgi:molecular chaperone GrpE